VDLLGKTNNKGDGMKRHAIAILLVPILIVGCHGNSIKTEEFLQDLDYYVNTIHEAHGDPFRMISEEDFDTKVKALRQYVLERTKGKISIVECFYYFQELAASIQDGHTKVYFPNHSWEYLEPIFPFRLKLIEDEVYVIEKWGNDNIPKFAQIFDINQIPIETLYEQSVKLFSTSLDHAKALWFERKFSHLLSTYHSLKAPWKVRFGHNGKVQTGTVEGMTINVYLAKWRNIRKSQFREYSFTVDGKKIPVLEIPSYSHGSEAEYHKFIDKFFKKYKKSEYLVIDLRFNGGGNGYWGHYLLDYLTDDPFMISKRFDFKVSDYLRDSEYAEKAGNRLTEAENGEYLTIQSNQMWTPKTDENKFRGKIFLLISERTFSAGAVTAAIFKFHQMGIIIGQETSGREKLCSDPVTIELPNSKLKATIPVAIYTLPGNNPDRGVIPDIKINYSINDYKNGVDKEMGKVKELIMSNGLPN